MTRARLRQTARCLGVALLASCGARSPLGVDADGPLAHDAPVQHPTAYCRPGDPPVVLAEMVPPPTSFAVDGRRAYWWVSTDGTIYAVALTGGAVQKLADGPDDGQFMGRVLADGNGVYWSGDENSVDWNGHNGGWVRQLVGSGAPTVLAQNLESPLLLAANAGALDWLTSREEAGGFSHEIARRTPDGAIATVVPSFRTARRLRRDDVAYDGARLFYAEDTQILSVSAGGSTSTFATGEKIVALGVGGGRVYWVDCRASGARLFGADATSKVTREIYAFERRCSGAGDPLHIGDTHAYLVDGSKLLRVPLDGGGAETVFDNVALPDSHVPGGVSSRFGSTAPRDLAVDSSCLYASYGSTIVRFPK